MRSPERAWLSRCWIDGARDHLRETRQAWNAQTALVRQALEDIWGFIAFGMSGWGSEAVSILSRVTSPHWKAVSLEKADRPCASRNAAVSQGRSNIACRWRREPGHKTKAAAFETSPPPAL